MRISRDHLNHGCAVVGLGGRSVKIQILGNRHPVLRERLQPFIVILRGEIDNLSDGAFRDVKDGSLATLGKDKD